MLKDPNGKIDRPLLPFPNEADLTLLKRRSSSVSVKMTETQLRIANIWGAVLPNCTAHMLLPQSNFFDEGGHSIIAQQMLSLVKKEWPDINMPVSIIFQCPTLEDLALEIDRAQDPIGLRLDIMPVSGDKKPADEAYAADARSLVQQLPESIPSSAAESGYAEMPLTVFLTGATGFLGSYILHELLEGPARANVIVLVRAENMSAAFTRLEKILKSYGLQLPSLQTTPRLDIVVGDLSQPYLGLSEETTRRLADNVDAVIHNGAQVNWMRPYSQLRQANVLSTLACIQLCAVGKPKRLAFISSTSTLDNSHYAELCQRGSSLVSESDDLEGSRKGLGTGYGQSKWASEYLVREAAKRGLAGTIIRPGYIMGDPRSGILITDDFLIRLWKGSLQVGARPNIPNNINAVPVTQVSRIVVAVVLHLPAILGTSLGVAQVTSHPRLTYNDWIGAPANYGYHLPLVPYPEWCKRVHEYVDKASEQEEFALLPLFHLVTGDLPSSSKAPELDDSNAMAALGAYDHGITNGNHHRATSVISDGTVGMYLAFLVAIGFLPPPTEKGKYELPKPSAEILTAWNAARLGGRSGR